MDSRFKIGDIVLFQPNVDKIDFKTMTTTDPASAVRAKVVQVQFTLDKVLYDIALAVDGAFYEIFPIRSVDSVFVCPQAEQQKPAPKPTPKDLLEELIRIRKEDEVKQPHDHFPYCPPYQPNRFEFSPNDFPPGTIICDVSKLMRN